MYKVGYTDTKAFRTTFKKITGLSPLQYRNKYSAKSDYDVVLDFREMPSLG